MVSMFSDRQSVLTFHENVLIFDSETSSIKYFDTIFGLLLLDYSALSELSDL